VIAWRESRDRAQLSRSREEQRDLFIFFSLCSLLFWSPATARSSCYTFRVEYKG
jgi:hypothetical protein